MSSFLGFFFCSAGAAVERRQASAQPTTAQTGHFRALPGAGSDAAPVNGASAWTCLM